MADILHRIAIKTNSVENVYSALSTIQGLAGWWTQDTQGEADKIGGKIEFRFTGGGFDMQVLELVSNQRIVWEVIAGEKEWIGSRICFELKQDGDYVVVLFKHEAWKEVSEFMHHCSTKWAIFLMSLKSLLETGKGNPNPYDVKIDNWN